MTDRVLTVCADFLIPRQMEAVYCIPTYQRSDAIVNKTLRVLREQGVPADVIHLYVANMTEKADYETYVPRELYGAIHVTAPGLAASRNMILDSWPLGKWIVMMDDDVEDVETLNGVGGLRRANLQAVVRHGFEQAAENGCCLWGVYPVRNAFFMKPWVTNDLKFCIGPLFGLINPGTSETDGLRLPAGVDSKEDYVRSLMAYDRDGAVIRINNVCIKTNFYKGAGGLNGPDRVQKARDAADYILTRWPQYTAPKVCKSKFAEIRFYKVKTPTTQIRPAPDFSS